jgi:small subunit ribosomal protein S29
VSIRNNKIAIEAPSLSDLVQLYPETIVPLNVGKASVFPRNTYEQIQKFGLPRKLHAELQAGAPTSVIRKETVELVDKLIAGDKSGSAKARYMLHGARGSGKSLLLVQAVAHAVEAGWIVVYEPEANKWIDSSSQFAYDAETQSFAQTQQAARTLNKVLAVNKDRLHNITLPNAVEITADHKFEAGSKLDAMMTVGTTYFATSVKILEVALDILAKQTQFPVLLAIDDAQALFQRSKYRQPDYSTLESYHLSMPRLALKYLTGAESFARGAIVGAVSTTATEFLAKPEFYVGLGLQAQAPMDITPYTKLDAVHVKHAGSGIVPVEVPFAMTGDEASALFEIFTRKGWASNASDDVFLGALQSSQGNPREFARALADSHQSYIA